VFGSRTKDEEGKSLTGVEEKINLGILSSLRKSDGQKRGVGGKSGQNKSNLKRGVSRREKNLKDKKMTQTSRKH